MTTDRFDEVSPYFLEAGLHPVHLQCIRIEPAPRHQLAVARELAAGAELLVVTSPRVISLLWPRGAMPDVDTAVVGPSTANAVAAAGGRVANIGDAGLERLVDLASDQLRERRVVLVHAAGSDPTGLDRLREATAELSECVIYESVSVAPDLALVDAVAFASPSAVAGWALARGFDDVVVGAIGTTTAHAVGRHRDPDVIAETPSYPALAGAIAKFMEVKV